LCDRPLVCLRCAVSHTPGLVLNARDLAEKEVSGDLDGHNGLMAQEESRVNDTVAVL
jgi:hypothetical protein